MIYISASVPLHEDSMAAWDLANARLLKASEGFDCDGAGTGFGVRDMDWTFEPTEKDRAQELYHRLVAEFSEENVSIDYDFDA
jgi:hypothetical protein